MTLYKKITLVDFSRQGEMNPCTLIASRTSMKTYGCRSAQRFSSD